MKLSQLTKGQVFLACAAFGLLILKLLAPGEIPQISADLLLRRLSLQATSQGARDILIAHRADLAGVSQMTFTLPECAGPLRVVAVSTQEDLSSAIQLARPPDLPKADSSVYAQGREYDLNQRFAMRVAAVINYLGLKFGLADIAPSGTLLAVLHDPQCQAYQKLDWPLLWSASATAAN